MFDFAAAAKLRAMRRAEDDRFEAEVAQRYGPLDEDVLLATKCGIIALCAHRFMLEFHGFILPSDNRNVSAAPGDTPYIEMTFEHREKKSKFLLS